MLVDMNSLANTLHRIKTKYENAILTGSYINLIRSRTLIQILHEFAIEELKRRVDPVWIHRDRTVYGYPKTKTQDILVQPAQNTDRGISVGPLLSINVRSQLSSIEKNYDTLFERLFAEGLNLHTRFPYMTLGYLYLLPKVGYDDQAAKRMQVNLTERYSLEKYIISFSSITNRKEPTDVPWKYEKICLLIVDFAEETPKVMDDMQIFAEQELVSEQFANLYSFKDLTIQSFFDDLVRLMDERYYLLKFK